LFARGVGCPSRERGRAIYGPPRDAGRMFARIFSGRAGAFRACTKFSGDAGGPVGVGDGRSRLCRVGRCGRESGHVTRTHVSFLCEVCGDRGVARRARGVAELRGEAHARLFTTTFNRRHAIQQYSRQSHSSWTHTSGRVAYTLLSEALLPQPLAPLLPGKPSLAAWQPGASADIDRRHASGLSAPAHQNAPTVRSGPPPMRAPPPAPCGTALRSSAPPAIVHALSSTQAAVPS